MNILLRKKFKVTMNKTHEIIKKLYQKQEKIYFIHYSCQNLSDDNEGYSPRITSIAVLHMQSDQMYSFSMHLIAEELNIPRDKIFDNYDEIEKLMLGRFFKFAMERDKKSIWIHWNMTNINFGFEALEHRYRVLTGNEPFHITEIDRYNLSKLIQKKHGKNYAKNPKMLNLMMLNGGRDRNFLCGEEEVRAYKAKEFIKLHNSTMCKVYFFKSTFEKLIHKKLHTDTNAIKYKINELYQNPIVQIAGIVGIIGTLVSLVLML